MKDVPGPQEPLHLEGATVTAGAMGRQRAIAKEIRDRGAGSWECRAFPDG